MMKRLFPRSWAFWSLIVPAFAISMLLWYSSTPLWLHIVWVVLAPLLVGWLAAVIDTRRERKRKRQELERWATSLAIENFGDTLESISWDHGVCHIVLKPGTFAHDPAVELYAEHLELTEDERNAISQRISEMFLDGEQL